MWCCVGLWWPGECIHGCWASSLHSIFNFFSCLDTSWHQVNTEEWLWSEHVTSKEYFYEGMNIRRKENIHTEFLLLIVPVNLLFIRNYDENVIYVMSHRIKNKYLFCKFSLTFYWQNRNVSQELDLHRSTSKIQMTHLRYFETAFSQVILKINCTEILNLIFMFIMTGI